MADKKDHKINLIAGSHKITFVSILLKVYRIRFNFYRIRLNFNASNEMIR